MFVRIFLHVLNVVSPLNKFNALVEDAFLRNH